MRHFYRSCGQGEYNYRVADMNMRDIVMIVRLFARRSITAGFNRAGYRIGIVVMIQRMFDAIQSDDRRLNRKSTSNYHAERGNRPGKSVGPQSEQTIDSFTLANVLNVDIQGNAMTALRSGL